ncbi:hypothetical protein RSAG8_05016, partial [Rhizoctonia solani AG-8 WAC10335]
MDSRAGGGKYQLNTRSGIFVCGIKSQKSTTQRTFNITQLGINYPIDQSISNSLVALVLVKSRPFRQSTFPAH